MDQDTPGDDFDEMFEPFELGEPPKEEVASPRPPGGAQDAGAPPPPPEHTHPQAQQPQRTSARAGRSLSAPIVACPSCGAQNPEYNRHCEECGAKLSQDPLPVAPLPTSRTSPGARALGVLAAVVLVVALVALIFNVFRTGENGTVAEDTTTSTAAAAPVAAVELFASSVRASSEIDNHEASNLIDGDPATDWNDEGLRGKDAWLEFTFAQPVQLTEIELQNLNDDERFKRNYKIQGYVITVDDMDIEIPGRLENTNDPQRIPIASLGTSSLIVRVTSTYTAEPAGDRPPFNELALEGVRFFGVER
jgi:hypothetical protein